MKNARAGRAETWCLLIKIFASLLLLFLTMSSLMNLSINLTVASFSEAACSFSSQRGIQGLLHIIALNSLTSSIQKLGFIKRVDKG